MRGELHVFDDPPALAEAGANLFARLAGDAVQRAGRFSVALSGGSTPEAMFALLAAEPYRDQVDWRTLDIFWSDERAVPPDDPQSNYGMARRALLGRVPVPPERVHRMPAERTPLDAAADEYAADIRSVVASGDSGVPCFDLVMLGMGEDGHTASLFPHTEALREQERLVVPNYVPKLNAHRLTFTPSLINAAAHVLFLIGGAGKAGALHAVLEGPSDPEKFPSQLVEPSPGTLFWYVDRPAAAGLTHAAG